MVIVDKDTTACYDRIINYVVLLTLHGMGMPVRIIRYMQDSLKRAKYRIKTGLGTSKDFIIMNMGQDNE